MEKIQTKRPEVAEGDVIQISPEFEHKAFAACMATVSEVKNSGVLCYVQALGDDRDAMGGQAYIRVSWEDFEIIGKAIWIVH